VNIIGGKPGAGAGHILRDDERLAHQVFAEKLPDQALRRDRRHTSAGADHDRMVLPLKSGSF
jgi:hypothetical protein